MSEGMSEVMMYELTDTTASAIAAAFVRNRRTAGSPAMGMVMTLVIVVREENATEIMAAAQQASREHPARVLALILGPAKGASRVDAQVGVGQGWGGEAAVIRLRGEVVRHHQSVVLPLLLPDSPVVVWWANSVPDDPAGDPLGSLATRRITDVTSLPRGRAAALRRLCATYTPGDTDLTWTRLTLWRALLAAAFDQQSARVTGATVTAERANPSAALLRAWLQDRLKVDVVARASQGPAITEVRVETTRGPVVISRPDGRTASFAAPGRPTQPAALRIRDLPELIAEELRHLDADDVYGETVARLHSMERTENG